MKTRRNDLTHFNLFLASKWQHKIFSNLLNLSPSVPRVYLLAKGNGKKVLWGREVDKHKVKPFSLKTSHILSIFASFLRPCPLASSKLASKNQLKLCVDIHARLASKILILFLLNRKINNLQYVLFF